MSVSSFFTLRACRFQEDGLPVEVVEGVTMEQEQAATVGTRENGMLVCLGLMAPKLIASGFDERGGPLFSVQVTHGS